MRDPGRDGIGPGAAASWLSSGAWASAVFGYGLFAGGGGTGLGAICDCGGGGGGRCGSGSRRGGVSGRLITDHGGGPTIATGISPSTENGRKPSQNWTAVFACMPTLNTTIATNGIQKNRDGHLGPRRKAVRPCSITNSSEPAGSPTSPTRYRMYESALPPFG